MIPHASWSKNRNVNNRSDCVTNYAQLLVQLFGPTLLTSRGIVVILCIMGLWLMTVDLKWGCSCALERKWNLPSRGLCTQMRYLHTFPDQPQSPSSDGASDVPARTLLPMPQCWFSRMLGIYFVCSVVLMVEEEYNETRWALTLNDVCLSSREDISIIAIILEKKWLMHKEGK